LQSVGAENNPQLIASPQLQGSAEGVGNDDLKLGGNGDGSHIDKMPQDEHSIDASGEHAMAK
jgi:hypothetical protein